MKKNAERIQRLKELDDEAALNLIFQTYYDAVYSYAFRLLKNHEDAEEVVNDTFSKAFRRMKKLRRVDNILGWLLTIAANTAKDRMRKATRHAKRITLVSIDDSSAEVDTAGDPYTVPLADTAALVVHKQAQQIEAQRQQAIQLKRIIRLLPHKDRQVMQLYYIGNLTQRRIAELTDTTVKSVKHRINRSKTLVKTIESQLPSLLNRLPGDERKMMGQYLLDLSSYADIATFLRVSPQDVVEGLNRAMARWKKIIARQKKTASGSNSVSNGKC